jgi:hypothetical protein
VLATAVMLVAALARPAQAFELQCIERKEMGSDPYSFKVLEPETKRPYFAGAI